MTQPHPDIASIPTFLQHQEDDTEPFVVVRALYNYSSETASSISLSFQKDDLIQVVAQQQSGWWYGFCRDARGWFPSNFVEDITQAELHGDDTDSDQEDEMASDDLWLPQTTPDGQVFYFNTRTGDSSWSIPTPSFGRAEIVQSQKRALPTSSSASANTPAPSTTPASHPASITAAPAAALAPVLASISPSLSSSSLSSSSQSVIHPQQTVPHHYRSGKSRQSVHLPRDNGLGCP